MRPSFTPLLFPLVLCAGLTAGAANRADSDTTDSAEGFWVATLPNGLNVKWAVLDGGETWGIYEAQGTILGAFHGTTHAANGVLHGSGRAFDIPTGTKGTAHHTGTYTARQTLSLTTDFGLQINGRYVSAYDQPAQASALPGPYDGEALGTRGPVTGMTLRMARGGGFAMTSSEGCTANGTATPRPGGKAVFNVRLHFVGQDCALGDGTTAHGVAHISTDSGELFILALNEAKTDGWLYLGNKMPG